MQKSIPVVDEGLLEENQFRWLDFSIHLKSLGKCKQPAADENQAREPRFVKTFAKPNRHTCIDFALSKVIASSPLCLADPVTRNSWESPMEKTSDAC